MMSLYKTEKRNVLPNSIGLEIIILLVYFFLQVIQLTEPPVHFEFHGSLGYAIGLGIAILLITAALGKRFAYYWLFGLTILVFLASITGWKEYPGTDSEFYATAFEILYSFPLIPVLAIFDFSGVNDRLLFGSFAALNILAVSFSFAIYKKRVD
jgi:hypothetical protein